MIRSSELFVRILTEVLPLDFSFFLVLIRLWQQEKPLQELLKNPLKLR